MKLTRAASYALHALVYLAARKNNDTCPSHIIARARRIPERFLLKILKPLVSARVLSSVKGPNGGYRLARPAKDISLLEVLEAIDGPIQGQSAYERDPTDGQLNKRLDRVFNNIAGRIRKHLQEVRISDL